MGEFKHQKDDNGGMFYYEEEGRRLAAMVYRMEGADKMLIEHTEVDESLKGQGIGKTLQANLVEYVRAGHIKVVPLCPFANATFQRMKEWQDVLA